MIAHKEEKFKIIFDILEEKKSEQDMFAKFLEMYPEQWKELKKTFSKFNKSKQFGKSIPLPKPEQTLKKEIRIWLQKQ